MSEATPTIAKEVADSEFERFAESMDLNLEQSGWDAEDKKSFETVKATFVRAVMRGNLIVNDKGEPVFTPQLEPRTPIVFHEPDGAAIMAMDLAKKGHDAAKTMNVLAAMTKEPPTRFSKMPNRDLKVCQAVMQLFLGSG
jgi:hypothetical protein